MEEANNGTDQIVISVIIVSFNTADVLGNCLRSIRLSTVRQRIQAVVIDNASQDRSADLVETQFPEVRLIRNSYNAGFAKACNQGIAVAKGRYILLLNSDVEVQADTFDKMLDFMDGHPEVGVAGCKLKNADGSTQASVRDFPSLRGEFFGALLLDRLFPSHPVIGSYLKQNLAWETHVEVDQVSGAFFMVRRETIKKAGLLDEGFFMYYEEVDWCFRIKQADWKIMYVPEVSVLHLGGSSAKQFKALPYVEGARSKILYFRKHYGAVTALLVQLLAMVNVLVRIFVWMVNVGAKSLGVKKKLHKGWSPSVAAQICEVIWFPNMARLSTTERTNA